MFAYSHLLGSMPTYWDGALTTAVDIGKNLLQYSIHRGVVFFIVPLFCLFVVHSATSEIKITGAIQVE